MLQPQRENNILIPAIARFPGFSTASLFLQVHKQQELAKASYGIFLNQGKENSGIDSILKVKTVQEGFSVKRHLISIAPKPKGSPKSLSNWSQEQVFILFIFSFSFHRMNSSFH